MRLIRLSSMCWIACLLLGPALGGCPAEPEQVCPPPLRVGDLTGHQLDNLKCCDALKICCKDFTGEDKTRCQKTIDDGGAVTCQADYHEFTSFEKCAPVYTKDHPELAPQHPEK